MKTRVTALLMTTVLISTGCGIKPRAATPARNLGRTITQEQIAETGARTMWDALTKTVPFARFQQSGTGRPERIRRRGNSSIALREDMPIYIDLVKLTEIRLLASLPARDIERIQVINGVDATTYYGTNAGDGVILIYTLEATRRNDDPHQRIGAF